MLTSNSPTKLMFDILSPKACQTSLFEHETHNYLLTLLENIMKSSRNAR